ncbi:LysR substrate-binding domain-containing protein [Amycolatopsis nigrescens]|uniref:LysR substrate-binding domain-containing protein n=1 Tax=Amycolatopsis nigrescens TaxID=381445 RepID=UPI0003A9892B|nr:LysR substrate-binding domain-containing protein [Amycolatopsis nigrescens]
MSEDVHLRHLRYFVAVAEELHFTMAAERLFVSQPTLSRQIHQLEAQVGAALFARDRRSVVLTDAGQALLPTARELVRAWDAAMVRVREASAARLRVGMSTTLGRGLLRRVRAAYAEARPSAELVVRQVGWEDATAGLADRSADVAFLWLPLPRPAPYDWLLVAEEPRLLLLSSGHRFAGRDEVDFTELLDEPWLALPAASGGLREFWLATAQRGGQPVRVAAEITTTDETYEALVDGVGVCLAAAGNAPIFTRDGVVAVPVRGLPPSQLVLAWRRDDRRPVVRDFVEAARRAGDAQGA